MCKRNSLLKKLILSTIIICNINAKAPAKVKKEDSIETKISNLEKKIEQKKQELADLEKELEKLKESKKPKAGVAKGSGVFYDLGSGTGKVTLHTYLYDKANPKASIEFLDKHYQDIRGEIPDEERSMITRGKGSPVYGEIKPKAWQEILEDPELNIGGFKKVVGIELSPTRYHHSKTICNKLKESGLEIAGKALECRHENITESDFSDATVIYMCSTCYPDELMEILLKRLSELKKGLLVITLKSFPADYADYGFELVKEYTLPMTWSETSPVYVYKLGTKANKPTKVESVMKPSKAKLEAESKMPKAKLENN